MVGVAHRCFCAVRTSQVVRFRLAVCMRGGARSTKLLHMVLGTTGPGENYVVGVTTATQRHVMQHHGCLCMFSRVGKRFCHHVVRGHFRRVRQLAGHADVELDRDGRATGEGLERMSGSNPRVRTFVSGFVTTESGEPTPAQGLDLSV